MLNAFAHNIEYMTDCSNMKVTCEGNQRYVCKCKEQWHRQDLTRERHDRNFTPDDLSGMSLTELHDKLQNV
jgi:hypothetical protein